MEFLNIIIRPIQHYFDSAIRGFESHFNQAMESVHFPLFCLIYSIVLIWLLRKFNEEAIFRPTNKEVMGMTII